MDGENQSYSRGKLIRSIRTTLRVLAEETIAGLCGTSTLGRYERGEEEPGKWVSDMLLERLGQIPDRFSCMYHKKEMKECLYRNMLMYFLQRRKVEIFWILWEEIWKELKREAFSVGNRAEKEVRRDPERNCQEQFLRGARILACYLGEGRHLAELAIQTSEKRAELVIRTSEELAELAIQMPEELTELVTWTPEELAEEAEKALRLTLPEEALYRIEGFRLGRIETALKALQADIFCQREETRENGLLLYQQLLDKVKIQLSEPKARYYQYQCLAALYLRRLALAGKYQETALCQECWSMIKEENYLYGMETLLRYEKEGGQDTTKKEARENALELLAALELWQWEDEGGADRETDWKQNPLDDFIELMQPSFRGLPLWESVAAIRKQKKLSQRKLGEAADITVKTIRRLEHGEVDSSLYTYQKVLKILDREGYRYVTDIQSNDFAVHEQYQKVHKLISHWDYKGAEPELERLIDELYRREPVNRQCIEMLQTILDGAFQKITKEEGLKRLKSALALTVPADADLETWPLMYQEIALLNNIANTKEAQGEVKEAEELLTKVVKNCERNPVGVDKNAPQYLLTLFNLERYLGNQGKHEEGIAVSKDGLCLSYRLKDGAGVVEFLYKLVWNRERIYDREAKEQEQNGNYMAAREQEEQKKKVCLPICRQTLALAELLEYTIYIEHIQKHCQKEYGVDISFPVD